MKNDFSYLQEFNTFTQYFLDCESERLNYSAIKSNTCFIKIFNSILFESDTGKKNKKIAYIVFWINFFIEYSNRKVEEPLLTTFLTIIDKLDLHQLVKFTSDNLPFDFQSEIQYETRKIFEDESALTNSQIDIFLSILSKKTIVISAPTSYGKTKSVLETLLISLTKGFINNFLVVLPTKSLINEYRKSINCFLKNKKETIIVTESPYIVPKTVKSIFLFTQERYLIFNNINKDYSFNYVLFDEVQDLINVTKLSENERSVLLAKSISLISNKNVPMIFLMPYVNEPYHSFISKFVTIDEDALVIIDKLYSPTSSKKYLIRKDVDNYRLIDVTYNRGYYETQNEVKLEIDDVSATVDFDSIKYDLYKICNTNEISSLNEKNLYFCKKADISSIAKIFSESMSNDIECVGRKKALITYLSDYFGDRFELVNFLQKGIAIHIGDLDNYTKRQIELLFLEDGGVNHIFCTTTLLQGVNLNANNLFFLAKKGKFTNAELDKKNLLGRVGRLGNCLQGRIFRFYVETKNIKQETIKKELNTASEPCEFSEDQFSIPTSEKQTKALKTYLSDKNVDNSITRLSLCEKMEKDCFDYFLGDEESKKVSKKISEYSEKKINQIIESLSLRNYDCYKELIKLLIEIYDWESSNDTDLSKRMSNVDFITRLFYNVSIGTSIKRFVDNSFEINEKKDRKPYVVTIKGVSTVSFLTEEDVITAYNKKDIRAYQDSDYSLMIYSTLRDVNNLIEFKLKVYLQDLYYRLGQLIDVKSEELESFLTHSVVGNKKKIALKDIGIVDDFAIEELSTKSHLFNDDIPNMERIIEYGKMLPDETPLKYSIKDVFGF